MSKYKFEINKETCFIYWIQSSIEWNWYFNQKEYDKWIRVTGEFNNEEKIALESFKKVLQREGNGYILLWNKYIGNEIKDEKERKKLNNLKRVLENKFEILWKSEYPKILQWKEQLEKYNFSIFEDDFKKIYNFFGVKKNNNEITVNLCFGWGKRLGGAAKKESPNNILLTLSNSISTDINQVLKTLFHENIHLIEYSSNKGLILKESYKKILVPLKIPKQKQSWRHLAVESIVFSIVGKDTGYLDKKIGIKENIKKTKTLQNKNEVENYSAKLKTIAKELSKLTEEYLTKGKELDEKYSDFVVKILAENFK